MEATQPAVSTMKSNEAQWQALGCNALPIACPAIACPMPLQATCASSGNAGTGTCQDLFGG